MTTINGSNLPLLKVLASPFVSLHQALTACEDCWTWSTVNGEVYEDVVLLEVNHDSVTIEHKYGVDTIARADLDEETQQRLIEESALIKANDHFAHARPMMRAAKFSHTN